MKVKHILLTAAMVVALNSGNAVYAKSSASVYVINHMKGNGNYFPNWTMSYNKNGLIQKIKWKGIKNTVYDFPRVSTYTYKGTKITKLVESTPGTKETYVYKMHYVKNKLSKIDYVGIDHYTGTKTFYYSGKNITKITDTHMPAYTFTYDQKGQLLTSRGNGGNFDCRYDKNGHFSYYFPVSINDQDNGVYYQNSYDQHHNLTKITAKKWTIYKGKPVVAARFTYKKKKVPANMVKKIKAQQRWIQTYTNDYSIYNF